MYICSSDRALSIMAATLVTPLKLLPGHVIAITLSGLPAPISTSGRAHASAR